MNVRVKFCGITTVDDLHAAADAGADAVGLNFHPASVRYVDPRKAMPLVRALPAFLPAVGVFVGLPMRTMTAMAYQLGLSTVQWHGDIPEVADAFPFRFVPAFRIEGPHTLTQITDYVQALGSAGHLPSAVLVDGYAAGQYGGTGQTAPWELLASFRPGVPLILAGGLTPENVAEAVKIVRPMAVDVAGGIESSPGRKDVGKMRAFVQAVRGVSA